MARVRDHGWPGGKTEPEDNDPCLHCGQPWAHVKARELLCVYRDVPDSPERPEPVRRIYASESWEEIGSRRIEIRQYEEGYCWTSLGRPSTYCWCIGSAEGGGNQPCAAARAKAEK